MEGTNGALGVLRLLRGMVDEAGRAEVDLGELGRATGLPSHEVRECLEDLQNEGIVKLQVACIIADDWR